VLSVMQRFLLVVFGFVKKISLINIYVEILFINLLLYFQKCNGGAVGRGHVVI